MKKIATTVAALAFAGLVIAGCSKPANPAPADPPTAPSAPQANSSVFTAKSPDGKLEARVAVSGTVALVDLQAPGFNLNPTFATKQPKDPKNADNEGHFIVTVDAEDPLYLGTLRTSLTKLEPGKRTLKVQMVNNDNSPTGVETTLEFDVKG